jgi:uncharacterized protein
MSLTSLLLPTLLLYSTAWAQIPDPALLAEINKIKAIDNHSHPPRLVAESETDDDYDALPCGPLEPTMSTLAGRRENPQFLAAWKALYGYKYDDMSEAHVRELMAAKQRVRKEQGDRFPDWVLDQSGIEVELANRVAMGRGLNPPRFLWVPFVDALMLPLNNQSLAAETPDRAFFYQREEGLQKRYLQELKLAALPLTLEQYTAKVVTPTLERQKQDGAVAVKFEAAYLRALDFQPASLAEANRVYVQYARGGVPNKPAYVRLQDYLFRYISSEAGRLGLPVHIHTGAGCGSYFKLSGADPLLLDSVLNDATLRKTNFVLIHGGAGPFTKQTAYLLMKPNVYADFSEQNWLLSTRKLSEVVRDFLEWYPEKVLFGTDLFPGTSEIDWEEIGWQTTQEAREALAIALTGMIEDKEITRARALELARMVLRENAAKLYGLDKKSASASQ